MKIKKYAIGGIQYTPYIPTTLGQSSKATAETTSTASKSTSSKSSSRGSATKKALLDLSKIDGITSDVYAFNNIVYDFLRRSEHLSEKTMFGGEDDDYSLSDVYKLQSRATEIKNNKKLFDKALENINKKNAWNDIATDSYGKLYIIDSEDNIRKISTETYLKDRDKYLPLTYKQLLGLREQKDSPLAFNSTSLIDSMSGTSTSTITGKLITAIKKFGSITDETYIDTLDKDTKTKVMAAHELLYNTEFGGPNGVYKLTTKTDLKENVEDFCRYLWEDVLDQVDRDQLENNLAVWKNVSPTKQNIYSYIIDVARNNTSESKQMNYKGDEKTMKTKASGSTTGSAGGDKKSDQIQMTLPEIYATGEGLPAPTKIDIMPWDNKSTTIVSGQNCGHVMADANGHKVLEDGTLKYVLENGFGVGSVTDTKFVYFGNNRISARDFDEIVVDNKSNMYRVYMPARMDNGVLVPDFTLNDKINAAQEDIKKLKTKDAGYINTLLRQKCGQGVIWDEKTQSIQVDNSLMSPFLVLKGYASTKITSINKNDHYINHLEKDEALQTKDWFNNIVRFHNAYGITEGGKTLKTPINDQKESGKRRLYEGNIFLPISGGGVVAQAVYQGQYVPWETYQNVTEKAMYHDAIVSGRYTSSTTPQGVRTNFK